VTLQRFLLREAPSLAFVAIVAALLRASVFGVFHVPSDAMRPTLMPGDSILVDRLAYGLALPLVDGNVAQWGEPRRGDVIVFREATNDSGTQGPVLVKRVVGIGGDKVSVRSGRLSINGRGLEEVLQTDTGLYTRLEVADTRARIAREGGGDDGVAPYLVQHPVTPSETSLEEREFIVPPGRLFCLGDNRDETAESRFWGFVSSSQIIGRAARGAYSIPIDGAPDADAFRWWRTLYAVR